MFTLNDDKSIYATRGDIVFFSVTADNNGESYTFQAGDVVRIKIYGKKDTEAVVLQKDFPVTEPTESVDIFLTERDTKIGEVISKHKDYWYEVELNPYSNPQTIIGYDEDGAKVFRLFPEGDDIPEFVPEPEDVAVMDDELDMTSTRPVQNQAIARAMASLRSDYEETKKDVYESTDYTEHLVASLNASVTVESKRIDNFLSATPTNDAELKDVRVGADGAVYSTAGASIRTQSKYLRDTIGDYSAPVFSWSIGSIALGGQDTVYDNRLRSGNPVKVIKGSTFTMPTGCQLSVRHYDEKWNFVSGTDEWVQTFTVAEDSYIRLILRYEDNRTITDFALADKLQVFAHAERVYDLLYDIKNRLSKPVATWEMGTVTLLGFDRENASRCRTVNYIDSKYFSTKITRIGNDAKYSLRYYLGNTLVGADQEWRADRNATISDIIASQNIECDKVRLVLAYHDDRTITAMDDLTSRFDVIFEYDISEAPENVIVQENKITPKKSVLNNCTILCAKEQTFNDGTAPLVEYYLLYDPSDSAFYFSKDLVSKTYGFTFSQDMNNYSFGILANGDVIAVRMAFSLESNYTDDERTNPYIWKASEDWSKQHEILFEDKIAPCGWLENCGFRTLPNGTTLLCEYTRPTVKTANAWKIAGDASDSANWSIVKSFTIGESGTLDGGMKHMHSVQHDHYTGICYLSTGDGDDSSMVLYSTDNGDTWAEITYPEHSVDSKQFCCRMLNMIFTENNVFWVTDAWNNRRLFKATRDANGVLNIGSVVRANSNGRLEPIPATTCVIPEYKDKGYQAGYGLCYLPELDLLFMPERLDGDYTEMDMHAFDLSYDGTSAGNLDGGLLTLGKLYSASGKAKRLGFRTTYTEWYPRKNRIVFGYYTSFNDLNDAVNHNRLFGNVDESGKRVNNLYMDLSRYFDSVKFSFGTFLL